jgi:hypothetical protein
MVLTHGAISSKFRMLRIRLWIQRPTAWPEIRTTSTYQFVMEDIIRQDIETPPLQRMQKYHATPACGGRKKQYASLRWEEIDSKIHQDEPAPCTPTQEQRSK